MLIEHLLDCVHVEGLLVLVEGLFVYFKFSHVRRHQLPQDADEKQAVLDLVEVVLVGVHPGYDLFPAVDPNFTQTQRFHACYRL